MTEPNLTIGQLADYVGVTVRAVRHYHQRGLLPEPGRDASGYRRYGADAVIELIRIKVLADAGVPLARVRELLGAGPEQLEEAAASIDSALSRQIEELERRRARVAALARGEDVFLPAELRALLDELEAAGVGPRTLSAERDGWILLLARHPDEALEWLAEKRALLTDPAFQRLYRAFDQAADWDRDDPRLERLADDMARYGGRLKNEAHKRERVDPVAVALISSHFGAAPLPALERLAELTARQN